jgi:pSer/pThr/pTyr-binding forkhead associated (FHA) protein
LPEAGLVVNGRPLLNAHRLRDGDVVVAGSYRLRYENLDQAIADRVLRTSGPGRVAGGGR